MLSIVTQFCFKAEPIVEWLKRLRTHGIDTRVRMGLAGPAGILTLTRYAIHCGIGNSLHALNEHPSFAKLLTENGPESIIRGIAQGIAATADPGDSALPLGIAGLHFYVFGGFSKTLDWIHAHQER
jgi:methylenetetrahydrofolate reductase (NADPH)